MRSVRLVLALAAVCFSSAAVRFTLAAGGFALAAVCFASPASAQPRILIVQGETQQPGQTPPVMAVDPATKPPAQPRGAVLPPQPRLGQPPASVPAVPPQAQNVDAVSPEGSPQKAQAAPLVSEHPKTQERVEAKPSLVPPFAGRYSFNRVDDGYLRLDKATGNVAYCSPHAAGWGCQAVPENRATLETEIARLRDEVASLKKLKGEIADLKKLQEDVASLKGLREEVAALKKEIAALRQPPPPRPPAPIPPPGAAPGKDNTMKLPNDQDLARARAYFAYTWQRLVDMINQFQKDMMGRREGANGLSRT